MIADLVLASAASGAQRAAAGSLLLAVPVAAAAGLVSFLSPCVLPLVPAYLSYVTGLSAADLAAEAGSGRAAVRVSDGPGTAVATPVLNASRVGHRRGRVLLGSVLFVAGFSAVFISFGAVFGATGAHLEEHATAVDRIAGAVAVAMGAAFLGLLPGANREWRVGRAPVLGIAGAPLVGIAFGVGWTPCTGPTLATVLTLAADPHTATAWRGAALTAAYCVGLGLPFVLAGLAFRRALGAFAVVKRHYAVVLRAGGALLVVVGVLLVTGVWARWSIDLRAALPSYTAPI